VTTELAYPHIEIRAGEPARLRKNPRIRVAQIVMDYLAHGWSVEEMCRQHPTLCPAQAHAAMSYYYDHQEAMDQEIAEDVRLAEEARTKAGPSSFLARIRARTSE
jgi:uncharacterized protein (DUF433 family)